MTWPISLLIAAAIGAAVAAPHVGSSPVDNRSVVIDIRGIGAEAVQPEDARQSAFRQLRSRGYREVKTIIQFCRDGRDYTIIRANRGKWIYLIVVDAARGAVVGEQPVRRLPPSMLVPEMSLRAVAERLRRLGYSDIRDLRYVRTSRGDYYIASASLGAMRYWLRISDETGEILDRTAVLEDGYI